MTPSPAAARLRFHRSLYPRDAVEKAVARFRGVAPSLAVEEVGEDVLVTASDVPARLAGRFADELANHALFEAILARRGSAA